MYKCDDPDEKWIRLISSRGTLISTFRKDGFFRGLRKKTCQECLIEFKFLYISMSCVSCILIVQYCRNVIVYNDSVPTRSLKRKDVKTIRRRGVGGSGLQTIRVYYTIRVRTDRKTTVLIREGVSQVQLRRFCRV